MHRFKDDRIRFFWDGNQRLGKRYASVVGPLTGRPAGKGDVLWDSYLLYGAGTQWQHGNPPAPKMWMTQLWGIPSDLAPKLDTGVLRSELRLALSASAK